MRAYGPAASTSATRGMLPWYRDYAVTSSTGLRAGDIGPRERRWSVCRRPHCDGLPDAAVGHVHALEFVQLSVKGRASLDCVARQGRRSACIRTGSVSGATPSRARRRSPRCRLPVSLRAPRRAHTLPRWKPSRVARAAASDRALPTAPQSRPLRRTMLLAVLEYAREQPWSSERNAARRNLPIWHVGLQGPSAPGRPHAGVLSRPGPRRSVPQSEVSRRSAAWNPSAGCITPVLVIAASARTQHRPARAPVRGPPDRCIGPDVRAGSHLAEHPTFGHHTFTNKLTQQLIRVAVVLAVERQDGAATGEGTGDADRPGVGLG